LFKINQDKHKLYDVNEIRRLYCQNLAKAYINHERLNKLFRDPDLPAMMKRSLLYAVIACKNIDYSGNELSGDAIILDSYTIM